MIRKTLLSIFAIIILLLGYMAVFGLATRFDDHIAVDIYPPTPETQLPAAIGELTIMTWNVGYAGLGATSDFIADGGDMLKPPSRDDVTRNIDGIGAFIQQHPTDLIMLQEVAGKSMLTHHIDMRQDIRQLRLQDHFVFTGDVKTRFAPWFMRFDSGAAIFSAIATQPVNIHRLTEEPNAWAGILKKRYHAQITEFTLDDKPMVAINIHLSAFDKGANTRQTQLTEVLKLGGAYYARGYGVIIGGDWNMRLTETDFPYTADDVAQFWLHDFPQNQIPDGWQLAYDPKTPTVRTNETPYKAGQNYTTIIDGFLVSPNLKVKSVATTDFKFVYTDHHPVTMKVSFQK